MLNCNISFRQTDEGTDVAMSMCQGHRAAGAAGRLAGGNANLSDGNSYVAMLQITEVDIWHMKKKKQGVEENYVMR